MCWLETWVKSKLLIGILSLAGYCDINAYCNLIPDTVLEYFTEATKSIGCTP